MATSYASAGAGRLQPIHGILAAYPTALFSTALATDVIYANSAQPQWANFSVWLITFGLIMGAAAAVAGIVAAIVERRRVRPRRPWPHSLATILMLGCALVNAFVHSRDGWTSVVPAGLILSAITTGLALVAAWLGHALERREGAIR